jgi:hypothetical protein
MDRVVDRRDIQRIPNRVQEALEMADDKSADPASRKLEALLIGRGEQIAQPGITCSALNGDAESILTASEERVNLPIAERTADGLVCRFR